MASVNSITITWAKRSFTYNYTQEYDAGYTAVYRVDHGKGSFRVSRDFTTDKFVQIINPGESKLPQNFIDLIGIAILINRRPKGWEPKK